MMGREGLPSTFHEGEREHFEGREDSVVGYGSWMFNGPLLSCLLTQTLAPYYMEAYYA